MALTDLFSIFSEKLEETFSRKPHDPAKDRKPLIRGIEGAKKQFENGSTKAPNRWWKASNGVVAFTPKLDGRILELNGRGTNHMPEDRFVEFLELMKAKVEAGDFDDVIASHGKGNTDVHIGKATGASRGPRSSLSNARSSVGRSLNAGKSLDEIEAGMRASGKFSDQDIATAIGERKA